MVAQVMNQASNEEWPLRKIKMKAKMRLDNTILALNKRAAVKTENKLDIRAVVLDLEKAFEETKALFEETDQKVESMRISSAKTSGDLGDYPQISLQEEEEKDDATEDEDGFQEESTSSEKFEPENRKGWDSDDPTVPQGWKTKVCPNGGGKMQKKFLDPFGKVCETRKQALQRMVEDPDVYSEEDILLMKSHMNNKMEKVFRRVVEDKKEGLNQMQEVVDELMDIEDKVILP